MNRPVGEQFLSYMKNVLKGDFGVSLKNGRNITDIFKDSFPISAKLGLMAIAVALVCGVIFGSIAALMRNKLPDRIIVFFSTLFTAVPSFVLATLLLLVFAIKLGWVPVWSTTDVHYTLPVIALAAYPMAYTTRLAKTSMLDALSQDYIRTAKANLQARAAQFARPGHHLRRPADRLHHHRLDGRRDHLYRWRHRQQIRQRHHQPRLYAHHGHDDLPRDAHGDGHADLRSAL